MLLLQLLYFLPVVAQERRDSLRKHMEEPNINAYDYLILKRKGAEKFGHGIVKENLFYSFATGVGYLIGSGQEVKEAFGPQASFRVGNWFTPVIGARIGADYGMWVRDGRKINLVGVGADYLINFSAFAARYDRNRFFEMVGVLGVSYQATIEKGLKTTHTYGIRAGLQGKFNVSPAFNLFIEPGIGIYPDKVDNAVSWRKMDLAGSVLIGFAYKPAGSAQSVLLKNGFASVAVGMGSTGSTLMNTEMALGKWLDMVSGVRLSAGSSTAFLSKEQNSRKKFNISLNADYLCNLSNLFADQKRKDRVFNLLFVAGVGSYFPESTETAIEINGRFGVQGEINLTPHTALWLEPRVNLYQDKTFRVDLNKSLKASVGLMVGATCKF